MTTNQNAVGNALSGVTGTGNFVGSNSPTLVTPALGTPASGNLSNCTGLTVSGGGTGIASATAYTLICAGTTTTGAFQHVTSVGTSGQVLTSNGASSLPTFQNAASGGANFPVNTDITSMTGLTGAISAPTQIQDSSGNVLLVFAYGGASTGWISVSATATTSILQANNAGSNSIFDLQATGGVFTLSDPTVTNPAELRFFNAGNSHYTSLISNATSTNIAFYLPNALPSTNAMPILSSSAGVLSFGAASVAGGGTGLTSTTAYAVLCGGTTSTGALQSIASVGTSGQVLTSNGAGALPTFQNISGGVSLPDYFSYTYAGGV